LENWWPVYEIHVQKVIELEKKHNLTRGQAWCMWNQMRNPNTKMEDVLATIDDALSSIAYDDADSVRDDLSSTGDYDASESDAGAASDSDEIDSQ